MFVWARLFCECGAEMFFVKFDRERSVFYHKCSGCQVAVRIVGSGFPDDYNCAELRPGDENYPEEEPPRTHREKEAAAISEACRVRAG